MAPHRNNKEINNVYYNIWTFRDRDLNCFITRKPGNIRYLGTSAYSAAINGGFHVMAPASIKTGANPRSAFPAERRFAPCFTLLLFRTGSCLSGRRQRLIPPGYIVRPSSAAYSARLYCLAVVSGLFRQAILSGPSSHAASVTSSSSASVSASSLTI